MNVKSPKKLIEVALPLDDINAACAHEKMPGIGAHPRGIHLWWARRPLAAARAVLFAQMVNDPGYQREIGYGVNKKEAERKREQLFDIIRELVKWENTNNEEVLNRARKAIWESWREVCHLNRNHPQASELFNPDKLPALHDPFAGGGAIPLEAQRLGMESYASDLNPVAVMINKAMIEIPPKFAGRAPVGPVPKGEKQKKLMDDWSGVNGLAEDIRRYGYWMHEQARKRIGHLYPKIKITPKMVAERPDLKPYEGQELTVIAWIWARTVKSPNPAFSHVDVPLISSFVLSSKKGKEAWVEPVVKGDNYQFEVRIGKPPANAKNGTKLSRGANFRCILSGSPIQPKYIKSEGKEGRLGTRLMAIVAEGKRTRIYLPPEQSHELIARQANPSFRPSLTISGSTQYLGVKPYGIDRFDQLFTDRQLAALAVFSDLVLEARQKVIEDAKLSGWNDDGIGLDAGGSGATAYGDAVAVYLSFCVDRCADFNNSLTGWRQGNEKIMYLFARQAIPMVWDFGEANIMENVVGGFITNLEYQTKCLTTIDGDIPGNVEQKDAVTQSLSSGKVISTDPPYYDNIPYSDLSDFFYIWMRRSLKEIYPNIFATLGVPKQEELVAFAYRHRNTEEAELFFMDGMTQAMRNISTHAHPAFPVTIYYAFKQSDTRDGNTASTGWETFLEAVLRAGLSIDGTWPMRSEQSVRVRGIGANALASSVVLVCRKRPAAADMISRREFIRQLREEMPEALEAMIGGSEGASPIAPVDLAQAAIGPGMAIFSRYEAVLNQDGSRMTVHDALILINRAITEYLSPESGSFDNDTQFCSAWFEQYGWKSGPFGEADVLARAKGTSVDGVVEAGVLESGGGKVRLLKWKEYPTDWDPLLDDRTPVWEALHHMIRRLNEDSESAAGELLARMPEKGEPLRQLAYHLYTLCERAGWAEDARAYNELIGAWHAIVTASHEVGHRGSQTELGLDFQE